MADRGDDVSADPPRAALLFDLDGTLVDTEDHHFAAFRRTFAARGIEVSRDLYEAEIRGGANDAISARFLPGLSREERAATMDEKETAYRDGLGPLAPTPGLAALLDRADALGLARAVVTNAPRANLLRVLDALGIAARMPTLVVAEELARGKPDPLPYLVALERLGADAAASVAFEESPSGARSAAGAGLAIVGISGEAGAHRLIEAGATFVARDFADPRIAELIDARRAR